MADLLFYLFLIAILALVAVAAIWVLKGYANGQSPTAAIFGPRPEKRLGVVEYANVDGRRRLLLVRRDGVEHLIMTGGPVDVVIETGIGESRLQGRGSADIATPVFQRQPRAFGQRSDSSETAEPRKVEPRAAE
jgi:hypothetical protein